MVKKVLTQKLRPFQVVFLTIIIGSHDSGRHLHISPTLHMELVWDEEEGLVGEEWGKGVKGRRIKCEKQVFHLSNGGEIFSDTDRQISITNELH